MSTTFGYDFTEAGDFGDYVTLTPGRYIFAFVKAEAGESAAKNPKAIVTLKVVEVEKGAAEIYVGGLITQHWPTTGAGSGRFKSFLNALGIKSKDRGKVNLAQYYDKEIGAIVELEQGDQPRDDGSAMWFHNLKNLQPGSQYRAMLGLDDEDEEPEEDEEEFEEEEGETEPWTEDDFDGLTLAELKEIAEDNNISTDPDEGKSKLSAAAMRARLIEALVDEDEDEDEVEEEEEEEEDEEDEDGEWTAEDIDALSLAELKELAEEWEVSTKPAKGKKTASAALLRKRLKDALEAEDEDEEDEEPF